MTSSVSKGQHFWRDLMTTDPERAEAFYAGLFGWSYRRHEMDEGRVYRVIQHAGGELGGIMGLDDAGLAPVQIPPHWMTYVLAPDVDATTARAAELGATVYAPPMDIPGIGRFSVIADPQGAILAPMSTLYSVPDPTADVPVGGVVWNELLASDIDSAIVFYTDLLGYGSQKHDMGEDRTYVTLTLASHPDAPMVAGIGPKGPRMPVSAWGIYFRVAKMDDARSRIEELGGKNHTDIRTVPGTGRMSVVEDPTGAFFSILEPDAM